MANHAKEGGYSLSVFPQTRQSGIGIDIFLNNKRRLSNIKPGHQTSASMSRRANILSIRV